MTKVGNVIKFYVLATSLKDTIRTGWLRYHVSKERLESVADIFMELVYSQFL